MSEQSKDGGPAFPTQESLNGNGDIMISADSGMSLRDWFAGQALNGIMAGACIDGTSPVIDKTVSSVAYFMADAMLLARSTPPAKGE